MIKLWVGTCYSGENEFEKCCEMIHAQKGVEITHHIIKNKSILDAFNDLYSTWNKVALNHDAFLQVDADMVLKNETVAKTIYHRMISQFNCNHIHLPVYDHFTMRNIWGIHMYGPSLRWKPVTNKNRPDKPEFHSTERHLQLGNISEKALVDHAPSPSLETAFHYGWHRRLRQKTGLKSQLESTMKNDPQLWRRFAIEGFNEADKYLQNFHDGIDDNLPIEYNNQTFIDSFNRKLNEHQQRENSSI